MFVCVFVCLCSLIYPACNAHAPYFHLCPLGLYNKFQHYLIKGTIFRKKDTKRLSWLLQCLQYSVRFPPTLLKSFQRSKCTLILGAFRPVSIPQNHNLLTFSSRKKNQLFCFLCAFGMTEVLCSEQEGSNKTRYILIFPAHKTDTLVRLLIK